MKKVSEFRWFICNIFNLHEFDIEKMKDGHIIKTCKKCNLIQFI